MPQRIRDYGVAALALAILFVVLTRVDERVPLRMLQALANAADGEWIAPGSAMGDLMFSVTANPGTGNIFALGLLVAAVVLLFLMVRT